MNGLNITFGQIPNIQFASTSGRRTNLIRMVSSLIQNDNELLRSELENNSVSENFMNELEEKNVTNEMIDKKNECSICLDSFKENEKYIQLPCPEKNHCFHKDCIKEWLSRNNTCPLCRTEFSQERSTRTRTPRPPFLLSNLMNIQSISNTIPDTGDNNIIDNSPEFILNTIDNFLRDVETIQKNGINTAIVPLIRKKYTSVLCVIYLLIYYNCFI